MTLKQFENLVKINQLKIEVADQGELDGLIKSGRARLKDSHNTDLSLESRFDLAYNAAHKVMGSSLAIQQAPFDLFNHSTDSCIVNMQKICNLFLSISVILIRHINSFESVVPGKGL